MKPLMEAGIRVIAPDQRGFGKTGNPLSDKGDESGVGLYTLDHLTGDFVNMMDALGIEKAIFAGHDWGGMVAWHMPIAHYDRCAGAIGINTPYAPMGTANPVEDVMRVLRGDNNYVVLFQQYGLPESVFEKDVRHTMRMLYRTKFGYPNSNPDPKVQEIIDRHELLNLCKLDESQWVGEVVMPDDELDVYVKEFERTGFRGGVNWYRNINHNAKKWMDKQGEIKGLPCLQICPEGDSFTPPELAEMSRHLIEDYELKLIPDCGHWVQCEQTDLLNETLIDWIQRRFMN